MSSIKSEPLGRYEVLDKLGRGKYSDVFLGVDMESEDETKVAIKTLKPRNTFIIP